LGAAVKLIKGDSVYIVAFRTLGDRRMEHELAWTICPRYFRPGSRDWIFILGRQPSA
jgi:hypothetical protein